MSDSNTTSAELTKLKLTDLRKLCKKHDLSTTGTKLELISRLIDNQGETFTILQPGDEAKLLGDDLEDESLPLNLTDAAALDSPDKVDDDDELINVQVSTNTEASNTSSRKVTPGAKRLAIDSSSAISPVPVKSLIVGSEPSASESPCTPGLSPLTGSVESSALSENERLNARAARFGLQRSSGGCATLTDDKLAARARRFGLPVNENRSVSESRTSAGSLQTPSTPVDPDVLRKRAERFGEVTTPLLDKLTEEERKASRIARFGPVSTDSSQKISVSSQDEEKRKAARALKFGLVTEEDKLQQRKARFGLA